MNPPMTVGELRTALMNVPDDLPVCLELTTRDGDGSVGVARHAGVTTEPRRLWFLDRFGGLAGQPAFLLAQMNEIPVSLPQENP